MQIIVCDIPSQDKNYISFVRLQLSMHRVMGNVPPISFIKDKSLARQKEVSIRGRGHQEPVHIELMRMRK